MVSPTKLCLRYHSLPLTQQFAMVSYGAYLVCFKWDQCPPLSLCCNWPCQNWKLSSRKWNILEWWGQYHGYWCSAFLESMMTSSNGNIFRVTGPLCGEFTGPGEFPTQRPVTRSFDVFFDLRLNKRLSKQPWGWWFETPWLSSWRHCNALRH